MDEDVGVIERSFHAVGIGHEIGAQVAAVELHALDDVERGLHRLGFLDRDDAVLADLVHGLGDEVADGGIVVGRNGADLGDLFLVFDRLGELAKLAHHRLDAQVDAALEFDRVGAGRDVLHAFTIDGLGQNGRRRGAVAGHVGSLRGDLVHNLGAHVLERIIEFDLFGHRHAVLGGGRRAEFPVDHNVAALRAESHFYSISQLIDAALNLPTSILVEEKNF